MIPTTEDIEKRIAYNIGRMAAQKSGISYIEYHKNLMNSIRELEKHYNKLLLTPNEVKLALSKIYISEMLNGFNYEQLNLGR